MKSGRGCGLADSGKIDALFDTRSSKDGLIPNIRHLEESGAEERASREDHFLIGMITVPLVNVTPGAQ